MSKDYRGHDWVVTHNGSIMAGDIVAKCHRCGEEVDIDAYMASSYGYCSLVKYIRCTCGARACGYGNSGVGHAHHCLGRGEESQAEEPLQFKLSLGYTPAYGP